MPACMLVMVLRWMTLSGLTSSTLGSCAARSVSASEDILTPGQMAPPRNSPFFEITPNEVAVPKSMKMHGPP